MRWHLQTNLQYSTFWTLINTVLLSTPSFSPTHVLLLLLLLPHSGCLSTSPFFSPPFPPYLACALSVAVVFYHSSIHTSIHPPSLSHLFYSSSRSILCHHSVPASLSLPHTSHSFSLLRSLFELQAQGWWTWTCENIVYFIAMDALSYYDLFFRKE